MNNNYTILNFSGNFTPTSVCASVVCASIGELLSCAPASCTPVIFGQASGHHQF